LDKVDEALTHNDVLVSSYLFPNYKVLADRQGKFFASFAFCHNTIPSPDYPPELIPSLKGFPSAVQSAWNMFFWRLANLLIDKIINSVIGKVLEKKGLPKANNLIIPPCDLVLTVVSKALMSDRGKIDDLFQFTGFLRWQSQESEAEEVRIADFRQNYQIPVLTFGSVAFDDTHAIMSRFEKNWPRGKKIIVQTGWSGLSLDVERPDILVVGKMSHDQLFRHASCVIHHGGAGTSASVLSAGLPHIVIPHIADQNFWGAEIERLGVGIILKKRRWPEKLYSHIQRIEEQPKYQERALEIQTLMEAEDGPGNAVKVLEEFVMRHSGVQTEQPLPLVAVN
jgi:vancomycin aglycone glucosyltransferase